ncbi:MAG: sulfatase-like hydrolase/transferase, partial [Oscillospiraceae bacterium]
TLLMHLKDKNLYDNTMIIFASDHGDYLGDYGMFFKGQMYDSCAKVPLIIKQASGADAKSRGTLLKEVVNTIDLYATVLETAGDYKWQTEKTESRTLYPLLSGGCGEWDNSTYAIIGAAKDSAQCMLRQNEFKLIRQATGADSAVYELYNVSDNHEETINLYENAKYADVRDAMQKKLEQWYMRQCALYPENFVNFEK